MASLPYSERTSNESGIVLRFEADFEMSLPAFDYLVDSFKWGPRKLDLMVTDVVGSSPPCARTGNRPRGSGSSQDLRDVERPASR